MPMQQKHRYILFTILLSLGLLLFLNGSRLVIKTYQRDSLTAETVRLGKPLTAEHEYFARLRGLKDGLLHVLLQTTGICVVAGSCTVLKSRRD